MRVGRGKNEERPVVERVDKVDAVHLRHFDIAEDKVDVLLLDNGDGIQGIGKGAFKL